MSQQPFTPLLASYGGGHANIIAAIAHALIAGGVEPHMLGFTTAYRAFLREGLPARSVTALIEGHPRDYERASELAAPLCANLHHPDIADAETRAYFAIGLHDLIGQYGESRALAMVDSEGRTAFEPVTTMQVFLEELRPSCIVTTTSPRFELALVRAGKRLGIPTIAVADIFLQRERGWVLSGDYADHLCVLNERLREELLQQAPASGMRIHATGNPAFDPLTRLRQDTARRAQLRERLGVADKTLILWPTASVAKADFADRPFASPAEVAAALDRVCAARDAYAYMLRPHPNAPHDLPAGSQFGILDPGLSPEDALLAADIVCFEVSTMGLQAHLAGIPTLCVGFADIAVFPRYSNAPIASDLDDMASKLLELDPPAMTGTVSPRRTGQSATDKVTRLIHEVGGTGPSVH